MIYLFDVNGQMTRKFGPVAYPAGGIQTAEFNGDGITDLILFNGERREYQTLMVAYDSETGALSVNPTGYQIYADKNTYVPADYDGDGLTDFLIFEDHQVRIKFLENGVDSGRSVVIPVPEKSRRNFYNNHTDDDFYVTNPVVLSDFNGDGVTDFAILDYGAAWNRTSTTFSFPAATLSTYIVGDDEAALVSSIRPVSSVSLPILVKQNLSALNGGDLSPNSIIQADLDANGQPEILLYDGADTLVTYPTRDGELEAPTRITLPRLTYGRLSLTDYNADQYPDFAVFSDGSYGTLSNGTQLRCQWGR